MLSPRVSHGGRAEADPEELKSEERERERESGGGRRASGEDWIGFCGGGDVSDSFPDWSEATFSSSSCSSTSPENKEDEKPK